MIDYFDEFKKKYGHVRRARGYYLYTEKGIRLLDMNLDNGRSILGRRPKGLQTSYKQKLDKGMLGFFPTQAFSKLEQVGKKLFPHFFLRVYNTSERAFLEAKKGFSNVAIFYPYSQNVNVDTLETFIFFPPFATQTTLVFFNEKNISPDILPSDRVPEIELFTITKALSLLQKEKNRYLATIQKNTFLPTLQDFFLIDNGYLYVKNNITEKKYRELFYFFLDRKILISNDISIPSIFPLIEHYSELGNAIKDLRGFIWK